MKRIINNFIFILLLFFNIEANANDLSTADRLDIIDIMNININLNITNDTDIINIFNSRVKFSDIYN